MFSKANPNFYVLSGFVTQQGPSLRTQLCSPTTGNFGIKEWWNEMKITTTITSITTRFLIHSHFSMAKKTTRHNSWNTQGKKRLQNTNIITMSRDKLNKVSIKVSKFPGATRVWGRLNVPSVEPHSQGSTVSITTWWPMQIKQGDFLMLMIVDLQLILSCPPFFFCERNI